MSLYLATNFNSIYWNTACLIVMSGALNEEASDSTTDYTAHKQRYPRESLCSLHRIDISFWT